MEQPVKSCLAWVVSTAAYIIIWIYGGLAKN
eukprot:CAMPEP_0197675140 /NCGR_PEP_ID=MMETSP1338-20131121/84377_1 /TAXON_ID=43686 ORGANISM="Pelagodinium beii, Strain RCC1491" /NCGR_SAMPLE_ID=MMETSP1338 /ASSEMBLY_ACC=CAM_ASM_000754 /LENGTH=30 /DNA_ID= /DNA_START= /DNA_END= /DNA_ORIENTATION=